MSLVENLAFIVNEVCLSFPQTNIIPPHSTVTSGLKIIFEWFQNAQQLQEYHLRSHRRSPDPNNLFSGVA